MATNKTQPTDVDPASFVAAVEDPHRRADAERMLELMSRVTGESARMWGPSMVGFGEFHYRSEAGREGDWMTVGFAPRKAATVVYLLDGLDAHEDELAALGPYRRGKGCLYIKKLDDVNLDVLESMVRTAHRTLTAG
jgi:hypothetical protein